MTTLLETPLGLLRATATDGFLRELAFAGARASSARDAARGAQTGDALGQDFDLLGRLREEMEAYVGGSLTVFSSPVSPEGTSFQEDVWAALLDIPYGTTTSYEAVAKGVGRPSALRAVAAAIGANPIAIVIPCHRVVGKDGSLTGYAGGLKRKRQLLDHEGGLFRLLS